MISEKQKLVLVGLSVALVGEVIAVMSLCLIYFNRIFFGEHINIIRMFVNASTAFFGCLFSLLAALLMFQFSKYREKQKEINKTKRLYTKLKKEYNDNYSILLSLGDEIANGSSELAKYLKENQKVRDLFVLGVYRLDFMMYDTYYHETDWQPLLSEDSLSEGYLELFEQSHQIEYLCQAIVERKIDTEESLRQLLVLITEKIHTIKQKQSVLTLKENPSETDQACEAVTESAVVEMVQE